MKNRQNDNLSSLCLRKLTRRSVASKVIVSPSLSRLSKGSKWGCVGLSINLSGFVDPRLGVCKRCVSSPSSLESLCRSVFAEELACKGK